MNAVGNQTILLLLLLLLHNYRGMRDHVTRALYRRRSISNRFESDRCRFYLWKS